MKTIIGFILVSLVMITVFSLAGNSLLVGLLVFGLCCAFIIGVTLIITSD